MSNIVEFFLITSNMHCALARMSVLAVASNKLKIPTINNKLTTCYSTFQFQSRLDCTIKQHVSLPM